LTDESSTPFQTAFSARLIDQYTTDCDGSGREEMSPTTPGFWILTAKESQIGFMHKGRRLQRLPGPFAGQLSSREPSKFFVYQREQSCPGARIPFFEGLHNSRKFTHR
jgi:hypothetical protein